MADYSVLYYPLFEPRIQWLRGTLLFVDSVRRIIPPAAKHQDGEEIGELRTALMREPGAPDPAPAVAPLPFELNMYDTDADRMRRAFQIIASAQRLKKSAPSPGNEVALSYDFIHEAKIPEQVFKFLKRQGLIDHTPEYEWETFRKKGYVLVQRDAGALILSYLADRIAKRIGVDAITDFKLGFAVNALNEAQVPFDPRAGHAEGWLLSSIMRCEVPGELRYLSTKDFVEVRKRFAGIREAFQRLTRELAAANRLDRIDDIEELQARTERCARKFAEEYQRYRKSRAGRKFMEWGPMSIAGLIGVSAVPLGTLAGMLGGAATFAISAVEKVFKRESPYPHREHAFQMLCGLQRDIIRRSTVRSVLHL